MKHKLLLTCADKFRLADFAVAVADGVHLVLVQLTTACVCEITHVVCGPALCHLSSVVFSCGHVVEGVVGGLPVEHNHIAGARVHCLRISRRTGHWEGRRQAVKPL